MKNEPLVISGNFLPSFQVHRSLNSKATNFSSFLCFQKVLFFQLFGMLVAVVVVDVAAAVVVVVAVVVDSLETGQEALKPKFD